jgi:hypothetical protein
MRQSQPSAAALQRYNALFVPDRGEAGSAWHGLVAWVQATLLWDSRQQPALAGLRSVGTRSYRIIYSAPTADVELWVVPQATTCSIEGDCVLNTHPASQDGPLVQLHSINDNAVVLETTATKGGRFQFAQVPAGVYDLWITPDTGQSVVLERLALP